MPRSVQLRPGAAKSARFARFADFKLPGVSVKEVLRIVPEPAPSTRRKGCSRIRRLDPDIPSDRASLGISPLKLGPMAEDQSGLEMKAPVLGCGKPSQEVHAFSKGVGEQSSQRSWRQQTASASADGRRLS